MTYLKVLVINKCTEKESVNHSIICYPNINIIYIKVNSFLLCLNSDIFFFETVASTLLRMILQWAMNIKTEQEMF